MTKPKKARLIERARRVPIAYRVPGTGRYARFHVLIFGKAAPASAANSRPEFALEFRDDRLPDGSSLVAQTYWRSRADIYEAAVDAIGIRMTDTLGGRVTKAQRDVMEAAEDLLDELDFAVAHSGRKGA